MVGGGGEVVGQAPGLVAEEPGGRAREQLVGLEEVDVTGAVGCGAGCGVGCVGCAAGLGGASFALPPSSFASLGRSSTGTSSSDPCPPNGRLRYAWLSSSVADGRFW